MKRLCLLSCLLSCLFLAGCCENTALPHKGNGFNAANVDDSVKQVISTDYDSVLVYKAIIDGEEYLIVRAGTGVSVVPHNPK